MGGLGVRGRPQAAITQLRQLIVRRYPAQAGLTRGLELLSACQMAIFALALASPSNTFDVYAYHAMAAVGLSEAVWAVGFAAIAVLISGGLALDVRWMRVVGMIAAASAFAFLSAMLWHGNPSGTGWGGNAVLCLFALRALRTMTW